MWSEWRTHTSHESVLEPGKLSWIKREIVGIDNEKNKVNLQGVSTWRVLEKAFSSQQHTESSPPCHEGIISFSYFILEFFSRKYDFRTKLAKRGAKLVHRCWTITPSLSCPPTVLSFLFSPPFLSFRRLLASNLRRRPRRPDNVPGPWGPAKMISINHCVIAV